MVALRTCLTEPFVADSTPQPGSLEEASTAGNIFQQQIQRYLIRLLADICADLQALDAETPGYVPPIQVTSVTIDIPSIGANGSFTTDFTTLVDVPLGTHILSWAPLTDATSLDDLIIQFVVVDTNTVRFTADNPSAGAVDPDPITFQFITATAEDTP
jgi:hypothetical protein